MVKILTYESKQKETKHIEVPLRDGSPGFVIRATRSKDRIIVESISDDNGRIATAKDLVHLTGLTVYDLRTLIKKSFNE